MNMIKSWTNLVYSHQNRYWWKTNVLMLPRIIISSKLCTIKENRAMTQFLDIRLYLKFNQAYLETCSHILYSVPLSHNGKAMYKCRSSCHARRRGKIPSGLLCLVISFVPLHKVFEHTSWILRSWQSCWISSGSERIEDLLII